MSQHDLEIANQGFSAFRADLNNALQALGGLQSGDNAPTTTYANMFWYETDTNKLYIRNEDNDAWIEILTLDQVNDKIAALTVSAATVEGDLTVDTDTLVVDSTNDRVGVGVVAPNGKLHVKDQTDIAMSNSANGQFVIEGNGYSGAIALNATGMQIYQNSAARNIIFGNNETEQMRIQSGGGISFNGDTAAANALDDYEEGGWVPTYGMTGTAATITHIQQAGFYRKIGSTVWIWGRISTNSWSGGSGNVVVNGLPFTASSASAYFGSVHFSYVNAFGTNSFPSCAYIATGGDRFQPIKLASSDGRSGANTPMFTSDMSNINFANDLIFAGSYIAS